MFLVGLLSSFDSSESVAEDSTELFVSMGDKETTDQSSDDNKLKPTNSVVEEVKKDKIGEDDEEKKVEKKGRKTV